jgi:hypothetical protein
MNRIRFTILAVIFILLLLGNYLSAFSQQQQSAPTRLVLEVTYFNGRPPAYLAVPGADSKPNGAWYGMFGHVPSWQPPAGFLPVQAVDILSHVEGDGVRIIVSVFVGAKMQEKEVPVANYLVRENEKIKTSELAQFGVEPFEIKVSRLSPVSTALPQVVNKTESVAVLNVEANNSTTPSYKLQLRNLSNKNIIALGVILFADNRPRRVAMPRRQDGRPLIEAGSIYNHNVLGVLSAQNTTEGYVPDAPLKQEIIITAAVFDDGSYEGDAQTAATVRAFRIGEKIQVRKIIPLMQDALNEPDSNITLSIENFKMHLASLSTDVDADVVNELQQAFPNLNQEAKANLKTSIEVSLGGVKFDLLRSLQQFEKANSQSLNASIFQAWMSKTKEEYEKWLARL